MRYALCDWARRKSKRCLWLAKGKHDCVKTHAGRICVIARSQPLRALDSSSIENVASALATQGVWCCVAFIKFHVHASRASVAKHTQSRSRPARFARDLPARSPSPRIASRRLCVHMHVPVLLSPECPNGGTEVCRAIAGIGIVRTLCRRKLNRCKSDTRAVPSVSRATFAPVDRDGVW
jgi:hypothetical protein